MRTPFHLFRPAGLLAVGLTMVAASACSSTVSGNGDGSTTDVIATSDGGGSDVTIIDTTVPRDVVALEDVGTPDRGVVTPDVPIAVDVVFVDTGPRMLACGASTCTPDQVCCAMTGGGGVAFMCATSCSDASVTINCESPSNCGGDPCCAQASMGPGGFNIGSVACGTSGTSCPPSLNLATRSVVTRLCTADSDCTSGAPASQLPTCCSVTTGSGTVHACLSALIASFASMQVTCP